MLLLVDAVMTAVAAGVIPSAFSAGIADWSMEVSSLGSASPRQCRFQARPPLRLSGRRIGRSVRRTGAILLICE